MKFSLEVQSEDDAMAQEERLRKSGYAAWHTRKADGAWEVFWYVKG